MLKVPGAIKRFGYSVTVFKGVPYLQKWRSLTAEEVYVMNRQIEASAAEHSELQVPCPFGLAFYGYQRAGVDYMKDRSGVLLADEMGLGKTPQSIGIINICPEIKRVLIICPANLKINWKRELKMWLVREDLTVGVGGPKKFPDDSINILSYEAAQSQIARLKAELWDLVIVDEAHYLKNPDAQRTKQILGWVDPKAKTEEEKALSLILPITAKRRIFATGTPIENRPKEIFPLIHALAPDLFPYFLPFAKRYCNAKLKKIPGRKTKAWDFDGSSNMAELQQKLRASIMVRRKKCDVLKDLPPKRRCMVALTVDGDGEVVAKEQSCYAEYEARKAELERLEAVEKKEGTEYEADVKRLKRTVDYAFDEIAIARHETTLRKVPAVIEYLERIVDTDPTHKTIIFAHHKDVIDQLYTAFKDRSVCFVGDMTPKKKQEAVDRFQTSTSIQFFFGNLIAAGVGLTLTAADHVIFVEFPWDPGKLSQAEDRAHRNGQRNSVFVEHLVLEGSIDVQMIKEIFRKQEILAQALDMPEAIAVTQGNEAQSAADRKRAAVGGLVPSAFKPEERLRILTVLRKVVAAVTQEWVGFSGVDAYIGQKLSLVPELSDKQASLAQRMLGKYEAQISPALFAELTPPAPVPVQAPAPRLLGEADEVWAARVKTAAVPAVQDSFSGFEAA